MGASGPRSVDLFCRVIDNYGDVGVCWRLARQLQHEYAYTVRLWIDNLSSFRHLCPAVDEGKQVQHVDGIEVRGWGEPFMANEPADLVVEGFACRLPDVFLDAMAAREPSPCWLNLDYLSAEDWVTDCHGLLSRHPQRPLEQRFFFPGFTPRTGGLLREADLIRQRDAFQGNAELQDDFWRALGIPARAVGERRLSLFSYKTASIAGLIEACQNGPAVHRLLVPEGRALDLVRETLGLPLALGAGLQRGSLHVHALPFLSHDDYDRLLWACDLNIVRGEDSFVRALWAARPLIWHIYPQEEDVHSVKLQAFLQLYLDGTGPDLADTVQQLWQNFNNAMAVSGLWQQTGAMLSAWSDHARAWSAKLELQQDLAAQLVKFHQDRLQSRVS